MPTLPTLSTANRHKVQTWYLTYPQSGELTREQVLAHLHTFDVVKEYLIASELHKDGHLHLHVHVKFQTRVTWHEAVTKLDVGSYYGNY